MLAAGDGTFAFEVRDSLDVPRARSLWEQGASLIDAAVSMARGYMTATHAKARATFDEEVDIDDVTFTRDTVF